MMPYNFGTGQFVAGHLKNEMSLSVVHSAGYSPIKVSKVGLPFALAQIKIVHFVTCHKNSCRSAIICRNLTA